MLAEAQLMFHNPCLYVSLSIALGGRDHPPTFTEEKTESQRKITPSGLGGGAGQRAAELEPRLCVAGA